MMYVCVSPAELNDFLKVLDKRADEQRQKLKHHAAECKLRRERRDAECEPPPKPSQMGTRQELEER